MDATFHDFWQRFFEHFHQLSYFHARQKKDGAFLEQNPF